MPECTRSQGQRRPILLLTLIFWAVLASTPGLAGQEAALRSVVALPATQPAATPDQDEDPNQRPENPLNWAIGSSAVVIDHKGTLLTLEEALPEGATTLSVVIPGGRQAQAQVVRRGNSTGAVLLRLDSGNTLGLTPLPIADSEQLRIGAVVWTLGNAFNALELDGAASVSRGEVSGRYEIPPGPPIRGRGGVILSTYRGPVIEVSAAVNDGNQGGALIDDAGQLLGLVSLGVAMDRKVGTAVPIHLILEDLGLELSRQSPPPLREADAQLVMAAERVAEAITLVYLQRPQGPGNPRLLSRPARVVSPEMPPYQRRTLQQQWDRYHHFQQVFYTDQAVNALVIDAAEGLLLTSLSNLHGNAMAGFLVDPRLQGGTIGVEVVGTDAALDLALLRAEQPLDWPEAPFRWDPQLRLGDQLAIVGKHRDGGPFTMTQGIVSAVERRPPGSRVPFVQIDALANYGNLGGAVINHQGEVIAMTTLLGPRAPWLINSGVSMAADAAAIYRALPPMRHLGGDLGRPRPGLGILVDDEMRIVRLVPGSGAHEAGIQLGDRIMTMDDVPMTDLYDLRGVLAGRAIGDTVTLVIQRREEELSIDVVLGRLD
ncbi:MAG: serine protease [Planctomycetota bacterium]|nr:MAG: serine protease [Planctomycetota bacterium]